MSSSRTVGPCSHWRIIWLTVCSSAPHLQSAEAPFVQAGAETPDIGAEAVMPDLGSSWDGRCREMGAGVGDEN